MSQAARQRRIARAEELAPAYPAATEILRFLARVLHFQQELQSYFETVVKNGAGSVSFRDPVAARIGAKFAEFLRVVEQNGPAQLAEEARKIKMGGNGRGEELLNAFWSRPETSSALIGAEEFFVRTYLQPYAEIVRSRRGKQSGEWTPRLCPYCLRKPGAGVLRPLGDGGQRFLMCSFCSGEWEFRRIVCAGCGEEQEGKLPVYIADEFNHVRVECCDSCRTYLKTVDLTKNGLGDPMVDEIAALPLDLWAQQQGYTKLQTNLMLM
jgi:FdhE protein